MWKFETWNMEVGCLDGCASGGGRLARSRAAAAGRLGFRQRHADALSDSNSERASTSNVCVPERESPSLRYNLYVLVWSVRHRRGLLSLAFTLVIAALPCVRSDRCAAVTTCKTSPTSPSEGQPQPQEHQDRRLCCGCSCCPPPSVRCTLHRCCCWMGCGASSRVEEDTPAFVEPQQPLEAESSGPEPQIEVVVPVPAAPAPAPPPEEPPAKSPMPVRFIPQPPPLLPPPPPPPLDETLETYTGLASLRELVRSGDIAFLRASHLLRLAAIGSRAHGRRGHSASSKVGGGFRSAPRLLRRQEQPADAFASAVLIERSLAELTVWDAYLTDPHQKSHAQLCRFPPFVVVSHAWCGAAHPDPENRLLLALAPVIEWYMSE